MTEGLEVVIQYKDQKFIQVNSPSLSHSQEIAILKKDLAHLRVHSPAQKNVRRTGGAFVLHWPTAGTSSKVEGLADSLHIRWFKLCSNDPEALKLREFLSIESITLTQDGVLLRSTDSQASDEGLHLAHGGLAARLSEGDQPHVPTLASPSAFVPTYTSHPKPPPQPPKVPPTGPRSDRLQVPHHPKRKMSNTDGPPPTRQKLEIHDTRSPQTATSPRVDLPPPFERVSMHTVDTSPTTLAHTQSQSQSPAQAQAQAHTPMITQKPSTPVPELGEITFQGTPAYAESTSTDPAQATIAPFSAPLPETSTSFSAPSSVSISALGPPPTASHPHGPALRLSPVSAPPTQPRLSPASAPAPTRLSPNPYPHSRPRTTSPHPKSASSNGDPSGIGNGIGNVDPSRRRDVQRLTRELWDTRRQLTAVQAREQVVLDDLERLGVRPEGSGSGSGASSVVGSVAERSHSRDEITRLEAELRTERTRRLRAERLLSDVERECQAPFVVPALFQAFMCISELSS